MKFFPLQYRPASRVATLLSLFGVLQLVQAWAGPPSGTPVDFAWWTDGPVYAVAVDGPTVYIGGDFHHVRIRTGAGVPLDTATGTLLPFPRVDGEVRAVVADGAGGWYIGGRFNQVGGLPRNSIAHILSDGTLDAAWNPNPYPYPGSYCNISALAIGGSILYVGGSFSSIGGQQRHSIAALNAATGKVIDWNPDAKYGGYAEIHTLAINGNTIYAGGKFFTIGGQERSNIAALDAATGTATDWNPNASGSVETLALAGTMVFAGGTFHEIGGEDRNGIVALDAATGKAVGYWDPHISWCCGVFALAVTDTTVYIGGEFKYSMAAFDRLTGPATAWDAWLPRQSISPANGWNPRIAPESGSVHALAVSGPTVYVGGEFEKIGGQQRRNLAALDVVTAKAIPWDPGADRDLHAFWEGKGFFPRLDDLHPVQVQALAVSGNTLYAGGKFDSILWIRNHIAALDTPTGTVTGWNPDANGEVNALTVSGGTVFTGGQFTRIGGQERLGIAALETGTGRATDWNPKAVDLEPPGIFRRHIPKPGSVKALAVNGGTLYAEGNFVSIGGQDRNRIAALDMVTGRATDWDPKANPVAHIDALAVSGKTVYTAGDFKGQSVTYDDMVRLQIIAFDPNTGKAAALLPNAYAAVTSAELSDLTTSVGSLNPAFTGSVTSYTLDLPYDKDSLSVRPVLTGAKATVTVSINGGLPSTVESGRASGALALNVGHNTVAVEITAEDGKIRKTYRMTVSRAGAGAAPPP